MKAFGRFVGTYGSRRKSQSIFGKSGYLMGAASDVLYRHGTPARLVKRFGMKAGIGVAAASYAGYALSNFRDGLVKGMYPGSVMPMDAGRFGIRTSASPAGIGGVRFHFRRSS